jgi:hypothetical protein
VLKDEEKAQTLKEVELVTWKENDPEDPRQWSKAYRWCKCHPPDLPIEPLLTVLSDITAVAATSVVSVAFGSAVVTGDFKDIQAELHASEVVVALSVSLMVVGFGLGPLAWSPLVCSMPSLHHRVHI